MADNDRALVAPKPKDSRSPIPPTEQIEKAATDYWHQQIDLQPNGVWTTLDVKNAYIAGYNALLSDHPALLRAAARVVYEHVLDGPVTHQSTPTMLRWLADRIESGQK